MTAANHIDIHLLQALPYANVNRDDVGSPKSLTYGGADRIRVSSQSWKRAVRLAMERKLGTPAVRTRRIASGVAEALKQQGWDQGLAEFAGKQVIAAVNLKPSENSHLTQALVFLPQSAIAELVELCRGHQEALETAFQHASTSDQKKSKDDTKSVLPSKEVAAIFASRNGIINLFGRMLAELPSGGQVDGAVQVAHAFTTHAASAEVDFFTAVDDLEDPADSDNQASAHVNAGEYASGVFYRYASLNVADLAENLHQDWNATRELTAAFLDAFIYSLPNAKKNSTAPFTVPELAYVSVRSDRPVSLAGAFEAPVRMKDVGGFAEPSRYRLNWYAEKIYTLIGKDGLLWHAHASVEDKPLEALGTKVTSYHELITNTIEQVFAAGER